MVVGNTFKFTPIGSKHANQQKQDRLNFGYTKVKCFKCKLHLILRLDLTSTNVKISIPSKCVVPMVLIRNLI